MKIRLASPMTRDSIVDGPGLRALEIDGLRQFGYTSTYLDTDELDSFRATAHKRARRGKVRTRRYLDSGLSFLEVKTRRRGANDSRRRSSAGLQCTSPIRTRPPRLLRARRKPAATAPRCPRPCKRPRTPRGPTRSLPQPSRRA